MRKIYLLIILISFTFKLIYSQTLTKQELDSLYNKLIYVSSKEFKAKSIQSVSGEIKYEKCGFGLVSLIVTNINRFTLQQQMSIKKILQRPVLQDSLITPDGFFKVHYDPSGINKPSYDNMNLNDCLNLISQALDSVYNFEIIKLGYLFPNSDNSPYDIYITNSTQGSYGYTQPENPNGDGTFSSYIVIHNNYQSFPTKGINGARVTLAHEFHHAEQIGRYIYRYDLDGFFYELSATAMEDFVFSTINDYYNYLPYYFNNTQNAFACAECSGGEQQYALAIWNIFLRDRFGYNILKRQWQLMPQMRALDAINNSILEYNSSYRKEFNEFGIWLFYTGYRAVNGKYFQEAANYPVLKLTNIFDRIPNNSISSYASPTSQNYMRFLNKLNSNNYDTLDVIISNSDYRKGIDSIDATFPYQFSVGYNPASAADNYYMNFNTANLSLWSTSVILNNEILSRDTSGTNPTAANTNYAYPNPFLYNINNHIEIPTGAGISQNVDLNIYSTSMRLVYSANDYAYLGKKGTYILIWNGLDSNGDKLPSGVYIYFTKSGDNTTSGKIVILNK